MIFNKKILYKYNVDFEGKYFYYQSSCGNIRQGGTITQISGVKRTFYTHNLS